MMASTDNPGDQEKRRRYWEWDGKDLHEFFASVGRCGCDNIKVRVREEIGKKGPEAFIDVIDKGSGGLIGTHNFSHSCPGSPGC